MAPRIIYVLRMTKFLSLARLFIQRRGAPTLPWPLFFLLALFFYNTSNNSNLFNGDLLFGSLPSSDQFSCSVVSNSLRPHESQHARPPCPSPTPEVHSNSCPSSRWCHPAISSSVVPLSSCPQSLPSSESFPMSQHVRWPKYSSFSFSHQSFQRTPRTVNSKRAKALLSSSPLHCQYFAYKTHNSQWTVSEWRMNE